MKTINELQDEGIEEFSDFDDWMDKYQLLIDLGNEQEPLAPEYKTCLLYTSFNTSRKRSQVFLNIFSAKSIMIRFYTQDIRTKKRETI